MARSSTTINEDTFNGLDASIGMGISEQSLAPYLEDIIEKQLDVGVNIADIKKIIEKGSSKSSGVVGSGSDLLAPYLEEQTELILELSESVESIAKSLNGGSINNVIDSDSSGSDLLAPYLEEQTELILELGISVESIANSLKGDLSSNNSEVSNTSLDLNTEALNGLSNAFATSKLTIEVNGENSSLMESFADIANKGNKAKSYILIDIANNIKSATTIIASAEDKVSSINKIAKSMSNVVENVDKFGKGMAIVSGGMALLGLSIYGFSKFVDIEDVLFVGATMATFGAIGQLGNESFVDFGKGTALIGIGLGALSLGLKAFEWEDVPKLGAVAIGLGALAFGYNFIGKMSDNINDGSLAVGGMGLSLFGFSMAVSNIGDVDFKDVLLLSGALGLLALEYSVIGKFSTEILKGSLAVGGIALATGVMSYALSMTKETDIESTLAFSGSLALLGGAYALIGNPVTLPFVTSGIAVSLGMSASIFALSKAVEYIDKVDISKDQMENFTYGTKLLTDSFAEIANPLKLPFLVLGIAQATAVSLSSIAMVGAMMAVSKVDILPQEKYDGFAHGAMSLGNVFADYGSPLKLVKITAGAGVATLVAGTSVLTATAINLFSKISADPSAVTNATNSMSLFLSGIDNAFTGKDYSGVKDGISSFFGVSKLVKEIADSVVSIGNLEFVEKEVVNGQIVTKGVRSYNESDFNRIGSSIGMMLSALTAPLSAIGGAKDEISIGGFSVANPFSNKVEKGIEALSGIGSVFNPLSTAINTFATNNIDKSFVDKFSSNLGLLLGGISNAFMGVNVDEDNIENISESIDEIERLAELITNENFEQGVNNFDKMANSIKVIKTELGNLDMTKLSKFNEMVQNINIINDNENIEELTEAITDLVEKITPSKDGGDTTNNTSIFNRSTDKKGSGVPNNAPSKEIIDMMSNNTDTNDRLLDVVSELYELVSSGGIRVSLKGAETF